MIRALGSDNDVRPAQEDRGATPADGNLGCSALAGEIEIGAVKAAARIEPYNCTLATMGPPQNIDDFLLFRLFKLSRLALHGVGLLLRREAAISRRDSRILAYVSKRPGVSLTQLAQIAELDPVVTSRCVASLVARGLIAKTRLRSNKRIVVQI